MPSPWTVTFLADKLSSQTWVVPHLNRFTLIVCSRFTPLSMPLHPLHLRHSPLPRQYPLTCSPPNISATSTAVASSRTAAHPSLHPPTLFTPPLTSAPQPASHQSSFHHFLILLSSVSMPFPHTLLLLNPHPHPHRACSPPQPTGHPPRFRFSSRARLERRSGPRSGV